jgi:hypothetical protein
MFMGLVVIQDQMHIKFFGSLAINPAQKGQPLLVSVAWHAGTDDLTIGDIESSEQGCGAIALVVVSHGATSTFFDRQSRLGAIQRLNLAFFIRAQHQSVFGRVEVKPHHIDDFLNKLRVIAQFEGAYLVGFEAGGIPHPAHHLSIDAQMSGQGADAPMGGISWLLLGCGVDNQAYELVTLDRPTPGARRIFYDPSTALFQEPLSPPSHSVRPDSQALGYGFIGAPLCGLEHNLRTLLQARWNYLAAYPTFKRGPF